MGFAGVLDFFGFFLLVFWCFCGFFLVLLVFCCFFCFLLFFWFFGFLVCLLVNYLYILYSASPERWGVALGLGFFQGQGVFCLFNLDCLTVRLFGLSKRALNGFAKCLLVKQNASIGIKKSLRSFEFRQLLDVFLKPAF